MSPRLQRNFAYRRERKYRVLMQSYRDVDHAPNLSKSYHLQKFEEKSDGVVGIIRSCETMKYYYYIPQCEWRK
jgi:hypothetical protein